MDTAWRANVTDRDLIYVAGHLGLAGSAILRALDRRGRRFIVTRTHAELELADRRAVDHFFASVEPDVVILAAALVGGIHANSTRPAEFIERNLRIQLNVIDAARRHGVRRLLFLGSSCIYPRLAPQPMKEEYLLTGALEPTNQAYAAAKLAGIEMCRAYRQQYGFDAISLIPTNLYGPHDNFSAEDSHVLPGLMRRLHDAKQAGESELAVWGTGMARREFLHADDFGEAACMALEKYQGELPLNIGCGADITVAELAAIVREAVGFDGRLTFDATRPDGTPQKLLDVSRLSALGWRPRFALRDGIADTYRWFVTRGEGRFPRGADNGVTYRVSPDVLATAAANGERAS